MEHLLKISNGSKINILKFETGNCHKQHTYRWQKEANSLQLGASGNNSACKKDRWRYVQRMTRTARVTDAACEESGTLSRATEIRKGKKTGSLPWFCGGPGGGVASLPVRHAKVQVWQRSATSFVWHPPSDPLAAFLKVQRRMQMEEIKCSVGINIMLVKRLANTWNVA